MDIVLNDLDIKDYFSGPNMSIIQCILNDIYDYNNNIHGSVL